MKKINLSAKGQLILMAGLFLITIILAGWGLKINGSTSAQIVLAQQHYLAQLKTAQNQLKSQSLQTGSSNSSTAPSSSTQNTPTTPASKTSSSTKQSTSTATVNISQSDKDTANAHLHEIQGYLEAYWANNGYYPTKADYSTLSSAGATTDTFSFPAGIHFTYSPSPSGCTTAAQNCQHYTLDALDTNNNAIVPQLKDLN